MKTMANVSATEREETPHVTNTYISNALRRRAHSVIKDKSIDASARVVIRYGLEANDPWLAELVRRADAGEDLIDTMQTLATSEDDSKREIQSE